MAKKEPNKYEYNLSEFLNVLIFVLFLLKILKEI